jgi:G3E family GTPase
MLDFIETVLDLKTGKTTSKKFTKDQIAEYDTITANQTELAIKKELKIAAYTKLGLTKEELDAIL